MPCVKEMIMLAVFMSVYLHALFMGNEVFKKCVMHLFPAVYPNTATVNLFLFSLSAFFYIFSVFQYSFLSVFTLYKSLLIKVSQANSALFSACD